uniref:Protein kinase domain-containing protein n=1 Tax=Arcella intermedia TaxID=1963864 RepID=A0A6B2LCL6_9EUKA
MNIGDIIFKDFVGHGKNSEVFRAELNSVIVAVKKIQLEDTGEDVGVDFGEEIKIMSLLAHPNLLSLIGVAMDQQYFYLVTEFMDGGSLADVVLHSQQNAKIQNYPEIIRIATEVAYGLHHLHSLKPRIIHRDLKPENILLTSAGSVKIGDFGLSKMLLEYSEFMEAQGTAAYMAPEAIKNGEYSEKTDIYAYGIILWQMYTEKPPYEDLTPFEIMFKVSNEDLRPLLPPACSKFYRDLYLDSIETDPEHRPTAKEIIQRLENAPKSAPFPFK